jgi:hypothetical protein
MVAAARQAIPSRRLSTFVAAAPRAPPDRGDDERWQTYRRGSRLVRQSWHIFGWRSSGVIGVPKRIGKNQPFARVCAASLGAAAVWSGVLLLMLSAASGAAQEAPKDTVIDLSYDNVDTRVRPCPCVPNAVTHQTLRVVLSKGNIVSDSVVHATADGKYARNSQSSNLLGRETGNGPQWRVLSSNKLERIADSPQNVRKWIITVNNDKECTLEIIDYLKPGFEEYTFVSTSLKQIAYYSKIQATNISCAIH